MQRTSSKGVGPYMLKVCPRASSSLKLFVSFLFCKKKRMLIFKSLFGGSDGNAGDQGWIPGSGKSPEKGMATHSNIIGILENSMDRGAWKATVHRVAKSWT